MAGGVQKIQKNNKVTLKIRVQNTDRIFTTAYSWDRSAINKSMTSLSPLQYQKQLRLTEAQRLMVVESLDASQAGLRVGYESQAQFNREYKRQFGEPPFRDVKRFYARQESL